jgi:tetratricopeptide (TPR) repeat protein
VKSDDKHNITNEIAVNRSNLLFTLIDIGEAIVKTNIGEIDSKIKQRMRDKTSTSITSSVEIIEELENSKSVLKYLFRLSDSISSSSSDRGLSYKYQVKADLYEIEANVALLQNDIDTSVKHLINALHYKLKDKANIEIRAKDIMILSYVIGTRLCTLNRFSQSIIFFERALDIMKSLKVEKGDLTISRHISMASQAYGQIQDYLSAARLMKEAIQLMKHRSESVEIQRDITQYEKRLKFFESKINNK